MQEADGLGSSEEALGVLHKLAAAELLHHLTQGADLAAAGLGALEKLRRLGRELFNDFKETAVGMMENIQDSDEDTTHILDKIAEQFQEFWRM